MKNRVFRGIPASPGIVMGKAYVLFREIFVPSPARKTTEEELATFYSAIKSTQRDLEGIIQRLKEQKSQEGLKLIEVQLLLLKDPFFVETVENYIREGDGASYAIHKFIETLKTEFESIGDPYIKDRFLDIKDVARRVMRKIEGETWELSYQEPHVLFAHDLTPSDTAQLDTKHVLGFVTETGGKMSHTAIIARALGIPAVVGVEGILKEVKNGEQVVIDGFRGVVVVDPDEDTKRTYEKRVREYREYEKELEKAKELPATTIDGKEIDLTANIEIPLELQPAVENGARGIGLYRTEFIFLTGDGLPDEETQFRYYREAAEMFRDLPVIFRTLDSGGDKILGWQYLREDNPFLGWRGIRLTLDRKEIFLTQIRAILKASSYGNVKIMLPMVSSVEEVERAKELLEEAIRGLEKEGSNIKKPVEMGIMVEVPSAAILSEHFAKHVDFFSIGTNDLTQYTLAVDRTNERISYLFDHVNPAVIRLMRQTIDAAHENGIWAGVCGEIASDPVAIPLLIGLNVDELSLTPALIPQIKGIIRGISYQECVKIAQEVLKMDSARKVRKFLSQELLSRFPHLENLLVEVDND